jgi:hypothetical protein
MNDPRVLGPFRIIINGGLRRRSGVAKVRCATANGGCGGGR